LGDPGPARARSRSRAELTADGISALTRAAQPGERVGSREELRQRFNVSVGTLHEALRLLQATGEITVRTGPGGGIFAGQRSALAELLRAGADDSNSPAPFLEVAQILQALSPLLMTSAVRNLSPADAALLSERHADLTRARDGSVQDGVRASLELFTTIVSVAGNSVLRTVLAALLRTQIGTLPALATAVADDTWRDDLDAHINAVGALVTALTDGDLPGAQRARDDSELLRPFLHAARLQNEGDGRQGSPPTRTGR